METFDELVVWLRGKGVDSKRPLHEMRKEIGSLIAEEHGIYAASRFLRHADIRITAAHYLDKKSESSLQSECPYSESSSRTN